MRWDIVRKLDEARLSALTLLFVWLALRASELIGGLSATGNISALHLSGGHSQQNCAWLCPAADKGMCAWHEIERRGDDSRRAHKTLVLWSVSLI